MDAQVLCALCHSLGNDGNFLPNTDSAKQNHAQVHFLQSKILDCEIKEDETLQRCFTRQPKVERPQLSRRECRRSFLNLCKSLRKGQSKGGPAMCNLCSSEITVRKGNRYNMARHACAHLEAKLFKCRHCDHSMSNSESVMDHIRRVHFIVKPSTEDFEDKTIEHFDDITNQIKRCFSPNYPCASGRQRQAIVRGGDSREARKRSVTQFCRSIFIHRSKPVSLECNVCGSRVSLQKRSQEPAMYQHAAVHLAVKLFICRHCKQSMSAESSVRKHLSVSHRITHANSDDFDDQTEKFHSEYLTMIERCFSADHVKLEMPPTENKSTFKAELNIRTHTNGSNLAIERHLFCNRLIRSIVSTDGKVKCTLCSKLFVLMFQGKTVSTVALLHAEKHLQKLLFRCKVCKSQFSTQSRLVDHLKKEHALGSKNNYENIADEFHQEIMAMLPRCYGAGG